MEVWRRSGDSEAWRNNCIVQLRVLATLLLCRCSYAGRPFGDEDFVVEMESKFGRNGRRWDSRKFTLLREQTANVPGLSAPG
jgi:putative transposase